MTLKLFSYNTPSSIKFVLVGIVLCLSIISSGFNIKKTHFISTGSYGGSYNNTGIFLDSLLNEQTDLVFQSYSSTGSSENLRNLENHKAEFALVQRDILLRRMYDPNQPLKNLEVIAPIFEEQLLVYAKASKNFNIETVRSKLGSSSRNRIGIVKIGNTGYDLFTDIIRYFNIYTENTSYIEGNYSQLINKLTNGDIDYLVSFSLPIQELEENPNVSRLYLDKDEMNLLDAKYPHLLGSEFKNGQYTFGSWTFLVASSDGINELPLDFSFFEILNNTSIESRFKDIILESYNHFFAYKSIKSSTFNGISTHISLKNDLKLSNTAVNLHLLFGLMLFLTLVLSAIYQLDQLKAFRIQQLELLQFKLLLNRNKHIIIGISVIAILYFICVKEILIVERQFFAETGIKSKLLNMTNWDLHFWVLISNLTNNTNGIFPLTELGQLLLSITGFVITLGIVSILIFEFIIRQLRKKKKEGKMKVKYENHIVVTGWNDQAFELIRDFLKHSKEYNNSKHKIVIVVEDSMELLRSNEKLEGLAEKSKIRFVSGDLRQSEVLEKSNIAYANSILLLAEDNTAAADEKTLLRALAISRFCRKLWSSTKDKKKKSKIKNVKKPIGGKLYATSTHLDSSYIIAQINNKIYEEDLKNADVNEIVVSSTYGRNVISQSLLNHGVSKVMDELLTFNEYNEFYTIDLLQEKNSHLIKKTFDFLLTHLRTQEILLIGIKQVFRNKQGEEIIDQNTIADLIKKDSKNKINRQIIVNPIGEEECKRKTDGDDKLIVFAKNMSSLEKGVANLRKSLA